ncbi:MAG: carboxypeptidase regulatory-like domain-containing protein [Chloroflexi bacterium]|nr:carboxypeptidase regulatory-like domain-containing protein [Chloroflexota bacterium]
MIPWRKLTPDAQKSILALMVLSGGANLTGCCPPVVCDPAPPPRTATPLPRPSPIICDPAPPPSVRPTQPRDASPVPSATRTPLRTPIICDPPPPPRTTTPQATATPVASRRFQLRGLQMTTDSTLNGAAVRGSIYDRQDQPFGEVKITLQAGNTIIETATARNGAFFLRVANPGSYQLIIGGDKASALALQLKPFDVANVEWKELEPQSLAPLPLAEIRVVDIVWGDDLTFTVETAWADARYRWSVSGGTLIEEQTRVIWQPPAEPGRYLLQLVADWGADGLAVDSIGLAVTAEGYVIVG